MFANWLGINLRPLNLCVTETLRLVTLVMGGAKVEILFDVFKLRIYLFFYEEDDFKKKSDNRLGINLGSLNLCVT